MTRSKEIIKRINKQQLKVNEIYEILSNNESLGFASYIYVDKNFLGIASTLLAPKISAFCHLINLIFKRLHIKYQFNVQALLYKATIDEVLKFPIIGKTTIELEKESSFLQDLLTLTTVNHDDIFELDALEIIIKPKRNTNIKSLVSKILHKVNNDNSSINLIITFCLSLICFVRQLPLILFNCTIMSLINNIVQISLITFILLNLINKSQHE